MLRSIDRTGSSHPWLVLVALMLMTVAVYWPSLHGGYIFDDSTYFVDNPDIHVTTLRLGDWVKAARAQGNLNVLARPLSSLTFAANYYFTGLDPFWPKLTNVGVHLFNGLLLFLMLRELFRLQAAIHGTKSNHDLAAAAVAGAWLLLPINLTGVAYVSQRMEALATTFVLLGLFWYLRTRRLLYSGEWQGSLWIPLAAFTAVGLTAKEDAALLPLYTACAEFAVVGFRDRDGRYFRPAIWTHIAVLLAPLAGGLLWMAPSLLRGASTVRNFSTIDRLLTEPRVLVDYIHWTLFPSLNALTFYHDDVAVSHGLFDPITTLAAILALLALLGVALWQRRARPLYCLGVLWFFAGHSMTATIIQLELVFEHRNYFPSIGLLLACASLIALEPGLHRPAAKSLIGAGFIAFCAFTTYLRAEEWSHPLRLAYTEALKRPESPRAQYELARTLIVLAGKDDKSPLIDEAVKILQNNTSQADSGITALQALIYINGRAHRPIDPRWWQQIVQKLRTHAPSQTDVDAVIFLYRCQMDGDCPPQKQELLDAFTAALIRSGGNVNLTAAYSDFALRELGDVELAERMSRETVAASPLVPAYRENLIWLLIATGQFDKGETELAKLQDLNRLGSLDSDIAKLRLALAAARERPPQPPQPSAALPIDPPSR